MAFSLCGCLLKIAGKLIPVQLQCQCGAVVSLQNRFCTQSFTRRGPSHLMRLCCASPHQREVSPIVPLSGHGGQRLHSENKDVGGLAVPVHRVVRHWVGTRPCRGGRECSVLLSTPRPTSQKCGHQPGESTSFLCPPASVGRIRIGPPLCRAVGWWRRRGKGGQRSGHLQMCHGRPYGGCVRAGNGAGIEPLGRMLAWPGRTLILGNLCVLLPGGDGQVPCRTAAVGPTTL